MSRFMRSEKEKLWKSTNEDRLSYTYAVHIIINHFIYSLYSWTLHHFTPLTKKYMNSQLTSLWLHSSVGRASHRYCRGHVLPALNFLQAFLFQLLKLETHWDDDLSLSYTSAVHIWIISYTLHQTYSCDVTWSQFQIDGYLKIIVYLFGGNMYTNKLLVNNNNG